MASQETFAKVSRVVSRLYGRLFSSNPYPLYKFLRSHYPLLRTPIGFWISTRYDNCVNVLRDKRFAAFDLNALDAFPPDDGLKSMREALKHAIVFRNPPDHTRLRKLMNTFFSPAVCAGLEPTIQRIFDNLLDKVQERGSTASGTLDMIKDLAFPFPIDVLAEVMGASEEDKPIFRDWMRTLGVPLDPVISANDPGVEVRQAVAAVRKYFSELAAERRKHPREDLISIMVSAEERGDFATEEELVFSAMFTLLAGHETTMNMIGNGMLALMRNPYALARLRSDPSLIDSALDEFLRFDSPVQVTFRTATEDIEVAGKTVPKGEHVVVFLGAANRDPERFADPDKLDIARPENHHLSFAAGPHRCIGEVLARVEGRVAFETILRRMPKLALANPNPKWRPAMSLRGLQALPLVF
jgi:pimeloyl-[acyl-carrier protein] synthase